MREENYIPAAWGIFYSAFGRKKQVSSLRELSRSVCYTALRQFRPKPQPAEALSPPPVASPQTNAIMALICSNILYPLLAPIRSVSHTLHCSLHYYGCIL